MSTTKRPKGRQTKGRQTKTQFKSGRRPHNARKGEEFGSIAELICRLGAEMKRVTINGKEVEMSWAERSFRLTVDRALTGNRRDLAQLLRLMIEHPSISGSYRERQVYYFRGALARA
ncbi:MAG: hypothetical protein ACR2JJ_08535 [Sphingomicrobium sp.]